MYTVISISTNIYVISISINICVNWNVIVLIKTSVIMYHYNSQYLKTMRQACFTTRTKYTFIVVQDSLPAIKILYSLGNILSLVLLCVFQVQSSICYYRPLHRLSPSEDDEARLRRVITFCRRLPFEYFYTFR